MKKTLIALLALGCVTLGADEWCYETTMIGSVDKAAVHGFTFTLTAENIVAVTGGAPLTSSISSYTLESLTLGNRTDGTSSVDFGLMVLDNSAAEILGVSNEVCKSSDSTADTFTFTGLTLDAATTYKFVTVNAAALNSDYIGKIYNYGKSAVTLTDNILTGGLVAPGVAVDLHGSTETTGLNFSTSGTFASTQATRSPILTEIKIKVGAAPAVPEPTTATLSLLALAGLAARRRRK